MYAIILLILQAEIMQHSFAIKSLSDTSRLAQKIAKLIFPGMVITLTGNLGSGKTTLTREILLSLGVSGTVKSPTFTLVEPYILKNFQVYHFDLYRFNDPEEWFYAGFDDYFTSQSVSFIEWAEKAQGLIPAMDWDISLTVVSDSERMVIINATTEAGIECLKQLIASDAD